VIRSPRARAAASLLPLVLLASRGAAHDGGAVKNPPIPEPLVAESITNIEGTEGGELEFDVEALLLRHANGGTASGLGVEAEWRATRHLGLAVEAAVSRAASIEPALGQVRAGLAWSLFHDLARDLHVQAEATGRFGGDEGERREGPLELPYPCSAGVRAALRSGPGTLRAGAGVAFRGGASLFVNLAALHTFGNSALHGFTGLEVNANVGAGAPLSFVPQVFVTVPFVGVPVDVGLGVPWSPGLRSEQPASIGGVLRIVLEP
jgi:hypothetical protein